MPGGLVLALGAWGLGRQGSLWRDEAATWQVAHRSLPQIRRMLDHSDVVHGLYYALMHMVFDLFGDSLATLRLPSVLAMAVAAALTADLGACLAGRWAGLGAGLAFALLPSVQEYAQEGRSYAMVTAYVALTTRLLVAAAHRPRPGTWAAYAVVTLVAALLNWLSLLALLAHAVTLLLVRPPRAVWWRWLPAAGAATVGALPLVLASRAQAGQVAWVRPATWGTVCAVTATVLLTCCLLLPVVAVRLPLGPGRGPVGRSGPAAVAIPLCALPPVALLTVSLAVQPLYVSRYVLFTDIGLALAIGALTAALGSRTALRPAFWLATVAAVAFLALLPVEQQVRRADRRVDDVLAAAAMVAAERGPGDGVLFVPAARRDTALVSPEAFRGLDDVALRRDAVESATLHGVETGPAATARALLRRHRVLLVGDELPRPVRGAGDRAKLRVLRTRFVLRSTTVSRGRRVSVYERSDRPARAVSGPRGHRLGASRRSRDAGRPSPRAQRHAPVFAPPPAAARAGGP
ncbi:hypothetical protein ACFV3R_33825 [Streptomyces sp. NPDC059740]|uniref:glycosyltransferase family 39 protein n=1 Tax=Streptomyces sp. NPDC059740 TaxID=3346926 RepID=UPI00364F4B95